MADHKKPNDSQVGEPVSDCWNATSQYLSAKGEEYFAVVGGSYDQRQRVARDIEEGSDGMMKNCSRECWAAADDHAMLVSGEQVFVELNGGNEYIGVYPAIEESANYVREVCQAPKKGPGAGM